MGMITKRAPPLPIHNTKLTTSFRTTCVVGSLENESLGFGLLWPVWVRSCRATWLLLANHIGHIEQAYGFSPVWVRSCLGTSPFSLKRLGHMEQA